VFVVVCICLSIHACAPRSGFVSESVFLSDYVSEFVSESVYEYVSVSKYRSVSVSVHASF